jgi:hypothetical protein
MTLFSAGRRTIAGPDSIVWRILDTIILQGKAAVMEKTHEAREMLF